jgi:hypothetical protein
LANKLHLKTTKFTVVQNLHHLGRCREPASSSGKIDLEPSSLNERHDRLLHVRQALAARGGTALQQRNAQASVVSWCEVEENNSISSNWRLTPQNSFQIMNRVLFSHLQKVLDVVICEMPT